MAKTGRLLLIFLILMVSTGVWILAQRSGDRPPDVLPQDWIPLTENAGIALKGRMMNIRAKHGVLLVRSGNQWEQIYLDSGPAGAIPLSR